MTPPPCPCAGAGAVKRAERPAEAEGDGGGGGGASVARRAVVDPAALADHDAAAASTLWWCDDGDGDGRHWHAKAGDAPDAGWRGVRYGPGGGATAASVTERPGATAGGAPYRPWSVTFDGSEAPYFRWFVGARTNCCFNAVDKHLHVGASDVAGGGWGAGGGGLVFASSCLRVRAKRRGGGGLRASRLLRSGPRRSCRGGAERAGRLVLMSGGAFVGRMRIGGDVRSLLGSSLCHGPRSGVSIAAL